MLFTSRWLLFGSRYRNWERSLRKYNRSQRWNICRWLTRGTYENLKFKKGWKSSGFINLPKQALEPRGEPVRACDMEQLHRQDREYRVNK